jgi:hypothetical protein
MEALMSSLAVQAGDFRSGEYRGRQIALLRHHRIWRVFLDQRLLEPYVFETAEEATTWLRRKIENHIN